MLNFVISHCSEFASCLIALTIQLYYGRTVRILVVNLLDNGNSTKNNAPWCGVSTISSLRGQNWEFLTSKVLRGVLEGALIPMESVHVNDRDNTGPFHPEFAVSSQRSVVSALISNQSHHAGWLYHPNIIIQRIKMFFAHSSNVSFTSVASEAALQSTIRKFGKGTIWLNFFQAEARTSSVHYDMVAQSNLSSFVSMSTQTRQSMFTRELPQAILWIPFLKAKLGLGFDPEFHCRLSEHSNVVILDVYPSTSSPLANGINENYDILHCLRLCGYVIGCVGERSMFMSKL